MSIKENLILWTEIYNGKPHGQNPVSYGWCVFPKNKSIYDARDRIVKQFGKPGHIVMTYTADRCACSFRASDPILGVFA